MQISMSERPHRFLALRLQSGLTSEQVAQKAGLTLGDEYRAETGSAIEQDVAERILTAFSQLTGKVWTMQEAAINVRKERI
jgi:transcriptional regulator with XRE-family HTH domain